MSSKLSRFSFVFLLLVIFITSARADAVDDFVRARLAERHIPGAAVAVIRQGRVVKLQGYGLASVEFNVPVTAETVFEIGSVSKQMTAAGILLLVEDGKIELDAKISQYLPGTPDSWNEVTVRHLLTHTSGIKNYTGLDGFALSRRHKRDSFIKELAAQPLDFPTGTRFNYNNSGYNLLGYIIESVSGKSYWDFMRERIFVPLKMTNTFDRDPQYIIKNRATGYEWNGTALVGRDYDLTDVFSAGAIVSTIQDLIKWDAAWRSDTLLKKETKALAWTPAVLRDGASYPYGFGWRFSDVRGHRLVAHSGQTAGFGANISRYTNDDLTVIALTNLGELGMGTLIAQGVAKIYLPEISLKAMKPQAETDPAVAEKIKTVLRERIENKTNAELLTPELARTLGGSRAKNEGTRLAAFGAINRITLVGTETAGDRAVYRYRTETPKRMFLWRVGVDKDGKIAELALEEEE